MKHALNYRDVFGSMCPRGSGAEKTPAGASAGPGRRKC